VSEEAIPLIPVSDLARALAWYSRLGFGVAWQHRPDPEGPAFASISRGEARIFISEYESDRSPSTVVFLRLADLPGVAAEFDAVLEHVAWGEEIRLLDPDGNAIRVGAVRS
jgi:catechol 2,3-dioxygenase-like lactoylglutathione lyase family enzyme